MKSTKYLKYNSSSISMLKDCLTKFILSSVYCMILENTVTFKEKQIFWKTRLRYNFNLFRKVYLWDPTLVLSLKPLECQWGGPCVVLFNTGQERKCPRCLQSLVLPFKKQNRTKNHQGKITQWQPNCQNIFPKDVITCRNINN